VITYRLDQESPSSIIDRGYLTVDSPRCVAAGDGDTSRIYLSESTMRIRETRGGGITVISTWIWP
jgi:hypothetical protein